MQRLTIRQDFGLHEQSREQQRNSEQQDQVRALADHAVRAMFPNDQASPGVRNQLAIAVSRLERCRAQDTDEKGEEHPTPLTLSTLDLGVPDSVKHLPQRRGAFDITPEGRTDAAGNLTHGWDPVACGWVPTKYAHGR